MNRIGFSLIFAICLWCCDIIFGQSVTWECPSNTSACLSGDKHKDVASAEDGSYAACLDYQSLSCCTAEFTQQLATSDVTHIVDGDDIFNWTHCGSLSDECEAYLISIECFYRCDPTLIYFAGEYESSLNRVPVCSSFCDNWFDACANDLTCVDNWVFDFVYNDDTNEFECPQDSECLTFEERYTNSTQLCNVLWGNSFEYIDDSVDSNECLTPGDASENTNIVDSIFSDICVTDTDNGKSDNDGGNNKNDRVDAGVIVAIVVSVVFVLGLLVYCVMTNRKKEVDYGS